MDCDSKVSDSLPQHVLMSVRWLMVGANIFRYVSKYSVLAVAGVWECVLVGQIILLGVPAGVCVPQHGHFPQPTSLGSQGEISGVLAFYVCLGGRGTCRGKVTGCVSCHRTSLCNGCYDFCFRQPQIVDILTNLPQPFHVSSGIVLQK